MRSVMPLNEVTWQIGAFLGSFIGGMLSHPAERYPKLFGDIALLKDWVRGGHCVMQLVLTECF